MSGPASDTVSLDFDDAEVLWEAFAPPGREDVLAREAFERALRFAAGLEDEGLYFRPGGWTIDLHVTTARVVVAAAVLGLCFHLAGLEDLDREVIIAAATLVASTDLRPVRLGRHEQSLADRLRRKGLTDVPISASEARRALAKKRRRRVSSIDIAEALDRLVLAGLADREGPEQWVVRGQGSDAWIRLRLRSNEPN